MSEPHTITLPDDRVTESLVQTIVDAYPEFSVTSHSDTTGTRYIMVQIPTNELNQEAPGKFVDMVSELDRSGESDHYRVECPECGHGWTEPKTGPTDRICPEPECGANWRA